MTWPPARWQPTRDVACHGHGAVAVMPPLTSSLWRWRTLSAKECSEATPLLDSHNRSESHMITTIPDVPHGPTSLGVRVVPRSPTHGASSLNWCELQSLSGALWSVRRRAVRRARRGAHRAHRQAGQPPRRCQQRQPSKTSRFLALELRGPTGTPRTRQTRGTTTVPTTAMIPVCPRTWRLAVLSTVT